MKILGFQNKGLNRKIFRLCIVVCLLITSPGIHYLCAADISAHSFSTMSEPDDADRIEVTTKDGYIYVTTSRNVTVSLYTILGQLVVRQSIQSGTTRIKAPARGVYILQAGAVTRRVTVN